MRLRWGLLRILWWQAMPATVVGCGLSVYVLFWPDVITPRDPLPGPGVIVLAHCLLLTTLLGSFQTPSFAFVYSRGYSRDGIWAHVMLTSALSVLAALLPACLVVWAGLRSFVQDHVFQSPYFPVMAPRETFAPLMWAGLYVLLVPALDYAWIRRAQPTRGGHGGSLVVFGLIAALAVAWDLVRYFNTWFAWLSAGLYAVAVVSLVLGGRALHRSLEVRA